MFGLVSVVTVQCYLILFILPKRLSFTDKAAVKKIVWNLKVLSNIPELSNSTVFSLQVKKMYYKPHIIVFENTNSLRRNKVMA